MVMTMQNQHLMAKLTSTSKNMRSLSQNLMTESLPIENLRNEARKIPPNYVRRAKRSGPHLSSLINVNTIPGVVKVHEGDRIHVDPRDIIKAIAETIGVTESFLSGKVQVSSVNALKTEAEITSLHGSGYCGKVTVSI